MFPRIKDKQDLEKAKAQLNESKQQIAIARINNNGLVFLIGGADKLQVNDMYSSQGEAVNLVKFAAQQFNDNSQNTSEQKTESGKEEKEIKLIDSRKQPDVKPFEYPYPWSKDTLELFVTHPNIRLFSKRPFYREGSMELYEAQLKISSRDIRTTCVRLNKKTDPINTSDKEGLFHYDLERAAKLHHDNLLNVTRLPGSKIEPSFLVEDLPRSEWLPLDKYLKLYAPLPKNNNDQKNIEDLTRGINFITLDEFKRLHPNENIEDLSRNNFTTLDEFQKSHPQVPKDNNDPKDWLKYNASTLYKILIGIMNAMSYLHDNDYIMERLSLKKIYVNKKTKQTKVIFFNFDHLTHRPNCVDPMSTKEDKAEWFALAAPESYFGPKNKTPVVTKESNIYSLACLAVKLFTGEYPYEMLMKAQDPKLSLNRKSMYELLYADEPFSLYEIANLKQIGILGALFSCMLERDPNQRQSIAKVRDVILKCKETLGISNNDFTLFCKAVEDKEIQEDNCSFKPKNNK